MTCDCDDDEALGMSYRCPNSVMFECVCSTCRHLPPYERYHACGQHQDAVSDRHRRTRGREPLWITA